MNKQEYYYTISKSAQAEFKDRGSSFIANAFPLSDVQALKSQLAQLKKEHPKASHLCFAYRIGIDGNVFRTSDAGEPSGTAGKPILGQIDSKELTNVCIMVVRYFGGTLLGVPGLINAYKTAASLVLQVSPIVKKQIEVFYKIEFDYTLLNDVMHLLKHHQCTIISQELLLFCSLKMGVPVSKEYDVLKKIKELHTLHIEKIL